MVACEGGLRGELGLLGRIVCVLERAHILFQSTWRWKPTTTIIITTTPPPTLLAAEIEFGCRCIARWRASLINCFFFLFFFFTSFFLFGRERESREQRTRPEMSGKSVSRAQHTAQRL